MTEAIQRAPLSSPKGWVDLNFAFETFAVSALGAIHVSPAALASAMFGNDRRTLVRDMSGWGPPEFARFYVHALAQSFASAVRAGKVETAYAPKGSHALMPMRRDWWATEDPLLRFRTCAVDPEAPYSDALTLPCWVYVNAAHAGELNALVAAWRSALPEEADVASLPSTGVTVCHRIPVRMIEYSDRVFLAPPILPDFDEAKTAARPRPANDGAAGLIDAPREERFREGECGAATRRRGRPAKISPALEIFERRVTEGKIQQRKIDEARAIVANWTAADPPAEGSVADALKPYYAASTWEDGKLQNKAELLAMLRADLTE